ncbi:MAG: hypothetical protein JNK61_04510 [Bacteroidia bacterium]|nr:hypothetical protein [Bacteroidia bacterium]HQV00382.1 hypothetical protein [Bacteroidia bacterium]
MKKIFLLLYGCIITTLCYSQNKAAILLTDLKVQVGQQSLIGPDVQTNMTMGKSTDSYILFRNDSILITAVYKLTAFSSRRSELKDGTLKLKIEYECKYLSTSTKTKVERMYYLDDKLMLNEKQLLNVKLSKFNSKQLYISYTGKITPQ